MTSKMSNTSILLQLQKRLGIRKKQVSDENDYDLLSAIWVMSCNDDNPLMFYESVRVRLQQDSDKKVKELISIRSELFRKGSTAALAKWKERKKKGSYDRIPDWIKKSANDCNDFNEIKKIIDELGSEDVFHSQFRTSTGAPKSSIEVIDWGLKHIDRLRSAEYQEVDRTFKTWQLWSVIVLGVLNIVVTLYAKK